MEDIRDIERSQNIRSRNSFLGKKNALIALGILAISASVIIIACSRGYLSSPVTHVAHSNTNPNLTNPALNAEDYNGLASPTSNSSLDDPSNLDINSSGQANSIPNTDIPNSNVNSYNEDYNRFASPAASSDTIYSTDIPTLNADAYDDYNGFASPAAASHSNSSLDDPSNPPWFNSSGQANTISNMDETASLPTSDFDDSFDNPSIPEIIADEQANAIPTLNTASLDVDCGADSGRDDSSTDTSIVNTASFESDSEHYPDTDDDSPSNSDLENPLLDSDAEDPQSESTEESNLIFFINWTNIYSLDQKPGTLEAKSVFSGEVDISSPVHRSIKKVSFSFLTPEQVRRQSVKAIGSPMTFDSLNHPVVGGLYDPALGPVEKNGRCTTCGLGSAQCPGHFGHIDLCLPVYNPLTFPQLFQLLRLTCLYCHKLRLSGTRSALYWGKLKLLQDGLLMDAMDLEQWHLHQEVEEQDGEEPAKLSEEEQVRRIHAHVNKLVKSAAVANKNQAASKSGLTSEHRRKLINEFLKKTPASSQCPHCRGYIPGLHRHAGTKIFLNPLRRTMAAVMEMKKMSPDAIFETTLPRAEEAGGAARFRSMTPDDLDSEDDNNGVGGMMDDSNENENDFMDEDELVEGEIDDIKLAKSRQMQETLAGGAAAVLGGPTINTTNSEGLKYLTPLHVMEHLKALFAMEGDLLKLIFSSQDVRLRSEQAIDHRIFFTQVLAVPPCRFRPPSVFGDSSFDHPQNGYLADILRFNAKLVELGAVNSGNANGTANNTKIVEGWIQLQEQVNYFFDSSRNTNVGMGQIPPAGIKQILEKKEGLFRKHMMGKRVNFAARSVISPDPNLDVGEIGVPMVFARKLTYPEPVTPYNLAKLQAACINGPEKYPGASHVQLDDGTLQALETLTPAARKSLATQLGPGKKVLRNLEDGDWVLMNRQPTLHKPSMMGHRVKVLTGEKTLRMHYANCDAYNADFDGDEMNMHFPQNELARSELSSIANTDSQYLVPTDGSPLRGLIQDHVVTGVILTLKDTFIDSETFQQLLFASLPESLATSSLPILYGPPAIQKPKKLWTGKQLLAAVLANVTRGLPSLTLQSKCKVSARLWTKSHAEESNVSILQGYWLHGVADKSQLGASANGLVHACFELYGGRTAGLLLSVLSRLLTRWDQLNGFTCRMDDLLLRDDAERTRLNLFASDAQTAHKTTLNYVQTALAGEDSTNNALERVIRDEDLTRGLDGAMKVAMNGVTSRVIEATLPYGQLLSFPANNMSLMTLTGAKGSMVNFSQISGCLGQQELEGRRVPSMVSGRTLPAFQPYCTEARAGGYIAQRFLTGIRPAEFYFHCMAGREGLIDTAVKTSRSGYLQRCLIKHLETLRVHYDHTVRTDDHSIVQFCYGEDGLDVMKQASLGSDQLNFCAQNFSSLLLQCQPQRALQHLSADPSTRKAASRAHRKPAKHSPVLSQFFPTQLGSTSEKFYGAIEDFLLKPENIKKLDVEHVTADQFRALMWLKYMRSLAEPGEAVGLLAAQSLGEPSTQMTLNTFHFAGFGAKNVTLGIPRLREIIMTASPNLKTPSMTLTLSEDWAKDAAVATQLTHKISRLTMKNVLQEVTVTERLVSNATTGATSRRQRVYSLVLELIPTDELASHYSCPLDQVRQTLQTAFIAKMMSAIDKLLKLKSAKKASAGADADETGPVDLITVTRSSSKAFKVTATEDSEESSSKAGAAQADDSSSEDDDDYEDQAGGMAGNGIDDESGIKKKITSYEDDPESGDDNSKVDADLEDDLEKIQLPSRPAASPMDVVANSTLSNYPNIRNYQFTELGNSATAAFDLVYSASTPKFLLLDVIERIAGDVVIRQVPQIQKAHLMPPEQEGQGGYTISTEGINFAGILAAMPLDSIDHTATTCNSIHAILTTYGVEAARATIVHEISAVFAVYGISIDPRHLSLIADYMTQEGGYRAFNRSGMENVASPFLKMTFETTVQYLKNATLIGETDELISPASRIVLGQQVALGTGSFEIRQPIY